MTTAQLFFSFFRRGGIVSLLLFLAAPGLADAEVNKRRAALHTFMTDGTLWDNIQAAAEITAVVQAEVPPDAAIEWVERAQLDLVEKELEFSSAFAVSSSIAQLKNARLNQADWLVRGRFTQKQDHLLLTLEVIDVLHADVLGEHSVRLPVPVEGKIRDAFPHLTLVTEALPVVLRLAREREQAVAGLPTIAVLFYPKDETFQEEFLATFNNSKFSLTRFRLLRFPRVGSAAGEIELALSGLAEDESGKWKNIADFYLWGSLQWKSAGSIDGETIYDAHTPEVTLNGWDGRLSPIRFVESGEEVERAQYENAVKKQARRLAMSFGRFLNGPSSGETDDEARRRISSALLEEAEKQAHSTTHKENYISEPEGRRHFINLIQTLEAACFFDPENRAARELLVRTRWNRALEYQTKNHFQFQLGRASAWKAFVDSFGCAEPNGTIDQQIRFEMAKPRVNHEKISELMRRPRPPGLSVAAEYLNSACELAEKAALGNREDYGFPKGIPEPVAAAWKDRLFHEVATRTIATRGQPQAETERGLRITFTSRGPGFFELRDPKRRLEVLEKVLPTLPANRRARFASAAKNSGDDLPDDIRWTFEELGQKGGEARFFENVANPNPSSDQPAKAAGEAGDISTVPVRNVDKVALPLEVKPAVESFDSLVNSGIYSISDLAPLAGKVWFIGKGSESVAVNGANQDLSSDLQPTRYEAQRLFCFDPATAQVERVAATQKLTPVETFIHRDALWLTFGKDGAGIYRPDTGSLTRFGKQEGLDISSAYTMAAVGDRVFLTANLFDLFVRNEQDNQWTSADLPFAELSMLGGEYRRLAGNGSFLFLFQGIVGVFDVNQRKWMTYPKQIPRTTARSPYYSVATDKTGFWFADGTGLYHLDPRSGEVVARTSGFVLPVEAPSPTPGRSQGKTPPVSRLPGFITALACDEDFLWIAAMHAEDFIGPSDIFLFHIPSKSWVCHFRANRTISLATDSQSLWLGNSLGTYGNGMKCLQRLDKKALYDIPERDWVAEP